MAQEKVLLLIDNTVYSERAAAFTVKLLKSNHDFKATMLFAGNHREIVPDVPGAGWISDKEFAKLFQKQADTAFQKALAIFQEEGFAVQTLVDYGDPVAVVTRLVKQDGYGLVVLGGKETGDRLNYVLSSNAYRLTHLLGVPMVVVK
jgi:nucleotide-binding universal stress UspA family protein